MWQSAHKPDGSYDWDKALAGLRQAMELCRKGSVRSVVSFLGANERPPAAASQPTGDPELRKYLTELVRESAKLGVHVWEPINEPDLGMSQQAYLDRYLKPQYASVKAGDPDAIFLGGSLCGLEKASWLRKLYALGAKDYFDGVSFHPYTGLGFQEIYRSVLRDWREAMAESGQGNKTLWMTESAWHRGWAFNEYVYDRFSAFHESMARNAAIMHLNAEACGIPRDRIYVFYLTEHGYNDFYLMKYKEPTSAAISIQVMNDCLRDAKFVREIPLPEDGHHLQLYRDAGRTVAIAYTEDEPAELALLTDAARVTLTDMTGNRNTLSPAGGKLKVSISGDPVYIQLGAAEKIEPDYSGLRVQPNIALPTLGATAIASSSDPKLPPAIAIAGDTSAWSSAYALCKEHLGWREDKAGADKFPDFYEVRLPRPAAISRLRIHHDYGAWSARCAATRCRRWSMGSTRRSTR